MTLHSNDLNVVHSRNPLHEKALGVDDLKEGMDITVYNIEGGVRGRFIVHKLLPYGDQVELQNYLDGSVFPYYLTQMGVKPYRENKWVPVNLTVSSEDLPQVQEVYQVIPPRRRNPENANHLILNPWAYPKTP